MRHLFVIREWVVTFWLLIRDFMKIIIFFEEGNFLWGCFILSWLCWSGSFRDGIILRFFHACFNRCINFNMIILLIDLYGIPVFLAKSETKLILLHLLIPLNVSYLYVSNKSLPNELFRNLINSPSYYQFYQIKYFI